MNLSRTYTRIQWNDYAEVPAIRAAILVFFFFSAAFLNYGFLLLLFVAYCVLAVKNMKRGKTSLFQAYIQCLSLETAVLVFGVLFELCFHVWKPALPALGVFPRMLLWLSFATVLLSTKFVLITHLTDALSQPKWFAARMKDARHVVVSFALLALSLALLLASFAGPGADAIPSFLLKAVIPGIV